MLDIPGRFLADNPVSGEEVGLRRPLGFGNFHWNIPAGVAVFQKVLHTHYFGPGPGSGGEGGMGAVLGSIHNGLVVMWYPMVRTGLDTDGERSCASDIPLLFRVEEAKVYNGVDFDCSAP